jgi:hypothetical protein
MEADMGDINCSVVTCDGAVMMVPENLMGRVDEVK